MALLHHCGNCHWMGSLDTIVNVSNGKELWIAKSKHQHLQSAGKYHNWMGYHRKRGRMQRFMKKDDESLIDVENV